MIPTQAIVECQFATDLPGILSKEPQLVLSEIDECLGLDLNAIHGSQKKAGVRMANRSASNGRGLKVRQTGLGGAEIVNA